MARSSLLYTLALAAGVAITALIFGASKGTMGSVPNVSGIGEVVAGDAQPKDAVLVFGATGKLGRFVVNEVRRRSYTA